MMLSKRCAVLDNVVKALESIASPRLAAKWDNVGLLIDSSRTPKSAYKILLTNDLLPSVVQEAIDKEISLIVSYHPTPFMPLKTFDLQNITANIIHTCISHGIAVYSPHTSWDVSPGGLTDWLAEGIASNVGTLSSVAPVTPHPDSEVANAGGGDGRIATLSAPASLDSIIASVKKLCKVDHVQVALPSTMLNVTYGGAEAVQHASKDIQVKSFAVCAGSGSSVLAGCPADVYITGEMLHHDVLAANHSGKVVILTHHSKSERQYLPVFAKKLESVIAEKNIAAANLPVSVEISTIDADPLVIL